jgi:hypothetical protein
MIARRVFIGVLLSVVLGSPLPATQTGGAVSYKIDGKAFAFKDGRMEYYKADGYIWLIAERVKMVADPSGLYDEELEISVEVNIQIAGKESTYVGLHEARSSDEMPTHFSWYEIVPTEDGKGKEIKEFLASLDSGDEAKVFRLKIDTFGPPGSLVKGTFSGRLYDEDGKLHEITDGVFSVPCVDAK